MTANWVFASAHSRGGRFHSAAAWFKTRYSSFVAASSEGKRPLVLTARRSFEFNASMAFVVWMICPTVAALELSRSKLATWASIGLGVVVILGLVVEAAVKWAVAWTLSHF